MKSFVRYLLVGGSAAAVDFALYRVLLVVLTPWEGKLPLYPEKIANAGGMVLGFLYSFVLNKIWSFQAKGDTLRQFVLSVALLLFNTAVGGAIISFLIRDMHVSPTPAKLILQAMVVVWNFLLFRYLIYKVSHGT